MLKQALLQLGRHWLPADSFAGRSAAEQAGWRPDSTVAYCHRCGSSSAPEAVTQSGCAHCRDRKIYWDRIYRLGPYKDDLARWLIDLKFHSAWQWADYFAGQLADITSEARGTLDTTHAAVIPVPLHIRRRLTRGYDQALLIARSFAKFTDLPLLPILKRTRHTSPQTDTTSQAQRRANIRGAFAIAPVDLTGRTIWLVDDVTTTGSTLAEATRLLRTAGAAEVLIAVPAVADPKQRDFQST